MNELHLFAGAGGGILAGQLLGHRTVCAVEWEPYAQAVLVARQNDGTFPPFPVWDDVQTFDGRPWRGLVDIVCGGFPCQDISTAGKGAGLDGERSGMWHHMARIIGEVRPRYVLVENSPALTSRGLGRVLSDLAALGFDAQWGVLGACDVGAPHKRERIWIVAHATIYGRQDIKRESAKQCAEHDGTRFWVEPSRKSCSNHVADASSRRLSEPGQWQIQQQGGAQAIGAGAVADTHPGQCNGADQALCTGRIAADSSSGAMADADCLRESQPKRLEQIKRGRPCHGCGYEFYHELLGIYRCPNCEGENLPDSDSDSAQGLEPKPQPGGHGRPAGLHDRARRLHAWPDDPADAPESGLGRVVNGMAHRSHRLKAIGNGQVSRVAATALNLLIK